MKKLLLLLLCFTTLAAFAQSNADFQPARVIAFEKVTADVQHPEKQDSYKISMRIGDTIYNCKANAPVAVFNDWTINKEFPTKVNAKTLEVKNFDGKMIEMTIVNRKKPK
jgi:hypothetical protein